MLVAVAAALWLATHPRNVWRRRRHSRAHGTARGRGAGRLRGDGVYPGSILLQHFLGRRRAAELVREEPAR